MGIQDVLAQYKLFVKYYNIADESQEIQDYQTAEKLRKKVVPQIAPLIDNDNAVEFAGLYGVFAEFLFHYFYCLKDHEGSTWMVREEMKKMAETSLALDPNSFEAQFFLVIHHLDELSSPHSGDFDAYHQSGGHPLENIAVTFAKSLTKLAIFTTTLVSSGMSKSKFTKRVAELIKAYKYNLDVPSLSSTRYLKMTSKLFGIAELCEDIDRTTSKDVYIAIRDFDIEKIDYSGLDAEASAEDREQVMELVILADSNL